MKKVDRPTKTEQLHEWRSLLDSKGEPAVQREADGSVSVGQKSPVSEGFLSTSDSYLRLIGVC